MERLPFQYEEHASFKLTHQTDKHDFYMGRSKGEFQSDIVLFNIVPKGDPRPTAGYFQPAWIIKVKGYDLKVFEVFPNDVPKEDIAMKELLVTQTNPKTAELMK